MADFPGQDVEGFDLESGSTHVPAQEVPPEGSSVTSPLITITPANGTLLGPFTPVVVDVIGDNVQLVVIRIKLDSDPEQCLVYAGVGNPPTTDSLFGPYIDTIIAPIAGGYRWTITHQGGWPVERVTLNASASNAGGVVI